MAITTSNTIMDAGDQKNKQQLSHVLFRIWPYWPVLLIFLVLGLAGAFFYLRFATAFYEAHAQIVVNDNSQEKDNNLNPAATRPDQRNPLTEVEKQTEIIQSKGLLEDVARELKLNVRWSEKDGLKTNALYTDLPVTLELYTPDEIKTTTEGPVKILASNKGIEFGGVRYPVDTPAISSLGKCRWHINQAVGKRDNLYLSVLSLSDAAQQLKKRFQVTPVTKQSAILDLSIIDESPARGEQIMSTLIDRYGDINVNTKKQILDAALSFIDDRLRLVSQDLSGVETTLQNYKSKAGITDLATEGQIYLGQVKDNDQRLSEIDVQLNVLNQIEQYVTKRNKTSDAVPATLGLSDQVLTTLLGQLFQDEFEVEKLQRLSGENNPQAKVLKDRIEQLKHSILESVGNLRLTLEASKKSLQANNSNFDRSLKSIPGKEKSLLDITRNRTIKNDLYTFLLQKREETAIASAAIARNYTIIEKPENYGLVKPRPIIIYAYGVVLAIFLAGLWVYKREFGNSRILYRSEIERRTPVPVIGEIIYEPAASRDIVLVKAETRTLIAEQFRELRANINYTLRAEPKGRVLLMTSSVPKEGKSFVATNLAMSFALSGKKTALVEFDLYRPMICLNLGITYDRGISDFFLGNATVPEICHPYEGVENLRIVPAGTHLTNPAELILNGKLPELLSLLKEEFDTIIIDSPCVGMVTDPKILAPYASLSLYVIRQNYTHHGFITFINELNETGNMPNMRIIYNGIKIKKAPGLDYWDSYGYNGYRYGNKNGYTQPGSEKGKKRKQQPVPHTGRR